MTNEKDCPIALLEAVDRELAFYRRRAGQVFFLGLLVEALILAGQRKLQTPVSLPWLPEAVYVLLFIAVAAAGIALGSEYRKRIHILKAARDEIISYDFGKKDIYSKIGGINLSDIGMLYVVLVFLSSGGLILVCLPIIYKNPYPCWFWWFILPFLVLGILGILWAIIKFTFWHKTNWPKKFPNGVQKWFRRLLLVDQTPEPDNYKNNDKKGNN
jgi:hypothetical protein